MGLSVRVYQNLEFISEEELDEYDVRVFVPEGGFENRIKYLPEGFYKGKKVFNGVDYGYSSHGIFRQELAYNFINKNIIGEGGKIIWEKLKEGMPFYELIWFSDCEGCIDHVTSRKLYKDFSSTLNRARLVLKEYSFDNYLLWLNSFKQGMINGVVVFG